MRAVLEKLLNYHKRNLPLLYFFKYFFYTRQFLFILYDHVESFLIFVQ